MTIELHHLKHLPLIPDIKVVRTRGVVNSTNLVTLWLWWAIDIELKRLSRSPKKR